MILLIASSPMNGETQGQVIFSLSPLAGIGLTATTTGSESYRLGIEAAAITPALLFAFVFNSLLIAARRSAHRNFALAAARAGKLLALTGIETPRQTAVVLEDSDRLNP
jgi:hypothetical protein